MTLNIYRCIIKIVFFFKSPFSPRGNPIKNNTTERKEEELMKKTKLPYEEAELEVVFFSTEDIVTVSTTENVDPSDDSWV